MSSLLLIFTECGSILQQTHLLENRKLRLPVHTKTQEMHQKSKLKSKQAKYEQTCLYSDEM